jgi:CDP-2,3-bis-(O-geranylgeranyl)-sn-glycerol synthase
MADDILFSLWFFLPAGVANMSPIFVARIPVLNKFNQPIDVGKTLRGVPIFGPHKTWRGLASGVLAGVIVLWLQQLAYTNYQWAVNISDGLDYNSLPIILLGALLGFGALTGDMIKSFFKRRVGQQSGDSWFPFDQLDYIAGGLLASSIVVRLEFAQYVWIVSLWFLLHLLSSYIGYQLYLKDKPI